ncbi:hypothetical protein [Endozoicomonas sp. ONNA1]|uniref:hypothetical protein n=1 Tax=Endozoicomonas sp. ONNA1 TaxID=2828740 RepID=UPI002148533B|nr:hypothetical protein [Endozoicomonas sp. ONNA1]
MVTHKKQKTLNSVFYNNTNTLANAIELGYQAIDKSAGNALTNHLNGSHFSDSLRDVIAVKLKQKLGKYKG